MASFYYQQFQQLSHYPQRCNYLSRSFPRDDDENVTRNMADQLRSFFLHRCALKTDTSAYNCSTIFDDLGMTYNRLYKTLSRVLVYRCFVLLDTLNNHVDNSIESPSLSNISRAYQSTDTSSSIKAQLWQCLTGIIFFHQNIKQNPTV